MITEESERISLESILLQHTSQSILTSAKTKVSLVEVIVSSGVLPGSYELLVDKNDGSLPHTSYIGEDDIWCSCVGFTSTLKERKLCYHLVIGFNKLINSHLLTFDEAQEYLDKWAERLQNASDN